MKNNNLDNDRIFDYDAFISYRHCELDQFVATNLHKKLEAFRMPKSVLPLIEVDKKKIERVFRDEDELPLADNLSDPIDRALESAEFLIVICTPRLKESRWCQREIETFISMHDRKHILLVLAEGEPSDSFPEILTYEEYETVDGNGQIVKQRREVEPLAADVRGKNKHEILKAMDTAVIKIAAAMFSLNYDDVKQRHREQKLKKMVRIWGAVSVTVFSFALVCLVMLAKINAQKNEIQNKYAEAMANASEELLGSGRMKDALYTARSVLGENKYSNSESFRVLTDILQPYAVGEKYIPSKIFEVEAPITNICTSDDGSLLLISTNNEISLFDTVLEKQLIKFPYEDCNDNMPRYAFDDQGLVFCDENGIQYMDTATLEKKEIAGEQGYVLSCNNSPIIILSGESVIGFSMGKSVYEINLSEFGIDVSDCYDFDYCFSSDGKYLALALCEYGGDTTLMEIDILNGVVCSILLAQLNNNIQIATNGDYIYLVENPIETSFATLTVFGVDQGNNIGSMTLPINFVQDIVMVDDLLLMTGPSNAILLNSYSFVVEGQLNECSNIVDSFAIEDAGLIIDRNGRIYKLCSEYEYGMDMTENLFSVIPDKNVQQCAYTGNSYFYVFSYSNYVTQYEKYENPEAIAVEEKDFSYGDVLNGYEYLDASDKLSEFSDIEMKYVYSAIYSSDNRFIIVVMYDSSIRVYDNKSGKLEKILYSVGNTTLSSLVYIKEKDIYLMNASPYTYIFDKNMNYISKLDFVVGYENGNFIVDKNGEFYSVPYISYKEMIEKADTILMDYVPGEEIIEKFGIMK